MIYEMSLLRKTLRWNSLLPLASRYISLVRSNIPFFPPDIDRTDRTERNNCKRRTSGNQTISEIESNQSGNCVIARVLPMRKRKRERAYWDISAGTNTGYQRKAPSGVLRASCSSSSLSLPVSPSSTTADPSGYPSGWNPGPGFRFAFGACPLTERVSHSIRNNALSAEALFRNELLLSAWMRVLTARARAHTRLLLLFRWPSFQSLSCKSLAVSKRENCVSTWERLPESDSSKKSVLRPLYRISR